MNIVLLESLGCSPELIRKNEQILADMGHNFTIYTKDTDTRALKERVKDADVIMLANMPLPKEVLEAAPKAKFIDVAFTGVDHIPMDEAQKRGIAVANASGYADDSVAELIISFMIQLLRDLDKAQRQCRDGGTKEGLRANLLKGKNVGIVGAGAIGKQVAALCKAFGAKVLAHNRHPVNDKNIDENVPLDELLERSDIVTLHTPLTDQTRGMIGKKELGKMKKTAFLVNTARGQVVDNAALANALDDGIIAGAACDVFDMEPPLPQNYPLLNCKNAIVTPHLAFYSEESLEKRAEIVFDNLYAWLAGKELNRIC